AIQMSRPLFGHGSDVSRVGRTAWIIGGMALLALSGMGAAATTLLFERSFAAGMAGAILAYLLIGIGIGASGTSLLALLASRTATPPCRGHHRLDHDDCRHRCHGRNHGPPARPLFTRPPD
ncbi:MAG: PucC family protein, partial [Rhizobiaceae bacterium]|nr:PucC family protein [Rhizobiaceae bacterium]